ncbi:MAG: UDP-N-acetylmuramate dehydrogenase [Clostridia bacterium]|nr:UDP-N-acetylmuramate dehydrogenase [Clostridia bacterium]
MGFEKEIALLLDKNITFNKDLKGLSTYKTGGNAKYFIKTDSICKISKAIDLCKEFNINYKIIGSGSNILFSDKGYNGLIIKGKGNNNIVYKKTSVICSAFESISSLISFCEKKGVKSLETLFGIPATIGGAVCQNASAFNQSISDYIVYVKSIKNGKYVYRDKSECEFSYRDSIFKHNNEMIISVCFDFSKNNSEFNKEYYLIKRNEIQPHGLSCGSVFRNPNGYYAGELIDNLGLKGFAIGGAVISDKHANFIMNYNNASSNDIYRLINIIKQKVYEKYNIKLKEEVEFVGEF